MSLITPHHLYDVRPATATSPSTQAHESARLSLFEEAWLQLPRRRVGDAMDTAHGNHSPSPGEGGPRA